MIFVFLSVICSVLVAICIKWAKSRGINHLQLVLWNYPVALLMTWIFLNPEAVKWDNPVLPWNLYLPLGILLPTLFLIIALSIEYSGIVKTEVAQRLSLFIPLTAAFLLFGERIESGKIIGLAVGVVAIICSIGWSKGGQKSEKPTSSIIYPAIVFLGMGCIDVLFKQVAQHKEIPYTASMLIIFALALVVACGCLFYLLFWKKQKFDVQSMFGGLVLGVFNFGNIMFYMKAHRAIPENPSIVFTSMNIGVIAFGALAGIFLFKEKLSILNKAGLCLAVISVLLIAYL
ncbi:MULTISPECIES: EamA family transporter [unclassified Sphingobacterium]|uniref:EamA family transporter n=1 Tax=unclassified Sphingobacterium TaxID=2609468 RepID=UPI0025CFA1AD|nr:MULTISPECIES: EamA family transporter [unclassified Sphingobacterium]